jgi:hypothetical protein
MQDFDVTIDDDSIEPRAERFERARAASRVAVRRFLMFVFFGPGVLGFLWLIGKLFKR